MNETKHDGKRTMKAIARILREAKPIRGWLVLSCFLCLCLILCTVSAPKILGNLIQQLYDYWSGELVTDDLLGLILKGLIPLAIIYISLSLVRLANMYLLNNVVSRYFTCNIRIRISEKIKRLPISFIDNTPVGEILRRMTDDVSHMGTSIHSLIETLSTGFLQIFVITVLMFFENWVLALAVLVIHDVEGAVSDEDAVPGAEALRDITGKVQPLLNEHLGVRAVLPGFLDGFQNEFQIAVCVHLHFVGVVLDDRAGGAHLQRLAELVFRQRMSGGAFGCGFRFSVLKLQFQPCGWIAVEPAVGGRGREDCVTIRGHLSAPPHP